MRNPFRKKAPELKRLETVLHPQAIHVRVRSTFPRRIFVRAHFIGSWSGWQDLPVEPGESVLVFAQRANAGGANVYFEVLWMEEGNA